MERDEVRSAIEAIDARVTALRARLEQHADTPLLEGEWRVRDALSHLAARANPVPNVLRRLTAHEAGTVLPRPDIHEVNAGQVEERADRPIALAGKATVVCLDLLVAVPGLPGAVPDLHVAHAPFDKPPRDEHLPPLHVVAVAGEHVSRLVRHVERIGRL